MRNQKHTGQSGEKCLECKTRLHDTGSQAIILNPIFTDPEKRRGLPVRQGPEPQEATDMTRARTRQEDEAQDAAGQGVSVLSACCTLQNWGLGEGCRTWRTWLVWVVMQGGR